MIRAGTEVMGTPPPATGAEGSTLTISRQDRLTADMKKLFLLALLSLATCSAAAVLPDNPRGRIVSQYLDAFNQGEATMRAFFEKNPSRLTVDERMARYRMMQRDLVSLTPVRLVSDDSRGLTLVARTADGRQVSFTAMTEGEPLHLAGLSIQPLDEEGPPPQAAGPAEDEKTVLEKVKHLVEQKAQAAQFSGAVLIARDAGVVWQAAYGFASLDPRIANQMDTRFDVGSIAKVFTRVAIGQLLEQKRLSLDDTVGRYLKDYPNPTVRDHVTIRQLLEMRSGIGDFFGEKLRRTPKQSIKSLADYLPLFANDPLLFEPGTSRKYSNGGYIVLGLIIENVTGESYYDYVEKNVFGRAGMTSTRFGLRNSGDSKQAIGYTMDNADGSRAVAGPRRPNLDLLPARGSSAGSAQSTAVDLLRFSQALAAGKLIAPAVAQEVDLAPDGMGIAGGAAGLNASLESGVESAGSARYTVVVLSNFDPPSAEDLSEQIRGLLRQAK